MYCLYEIAILTHVTDTRVFDAYILPTTVEFDLTIADAPADLVTDAVPDEPCTREIAAHSSAIVSVSIDTVPVMPGLASPLNCFACLTRPMPLSLIPAPAVVDSAFFLYQPVYDSIISVTGAIEWSRRLSARFSPPDSGTRPSIPSGDGERASNNPV